MCNDIIICPRCGTDHVKVERECFYCLNDECSSTRPYKRKDKEYKRKLKDKEYKRKIKKEINALMAEFQDLYSGDLSGEAVSLLLTKLREL